MNARKQKSKAKPPIKVWIGDEEYDSTMEGRHQIIFNAMGLNVRHHPSVSVDYCEPDYVTDEWNLSGKLYIESKDDFYQGNLRHSLDFGKSTGSYVYYMGAIQRPDSLYDVYSQAAGKAFRSGNHGFRQFQRYLGGMKDGCYIPMVSNDGELTLIPLYQEYPGLHDLIDKMLMDYNIDTQKTLYAYQYGATFTDWDATQGPDDDHPITREERKLMMTQAMNEPTEKRTRKTVNEQQSLWGGPAPIADNVKFDGNKDIINKYLSDIGFIPSRIRGGDYVLTAYDAVNGSEEKFKTIFKCFYPLPKGVGYKLFHHLIVEAITDCVCKHWDVIGNDPDWFVSRLHVEIVKHRDKLLGELRSGDDAKDVVIAKKYNKFADKHGAKKIDVPDEPVKRAAVSVKLVPDKTWADDLTEFVESIGRQHNESPDITAQYIKDLISCISHLT